jgi:hypothetical protein
MRIATFSAVVRRVAAVAARVPLHFSTWGRCSLAMLIMLNIAGCGTGTYQDRTAERLVELRRKSKFQEMLERRPYEISDSQAQMLGVKLRLPRGFESDGKALRTGYVEQSSRDEYVIPESRVQPPFMQFRNFCMSYELFHPTYPVTWKNRLLPAYIYFAVTRVNTPEGETIEQQVILDEIQQAVVKGFGAGAAAAAEAEAAAAGGEAAESVPADETTADDGEAPDGPFAWKTVTLDTPDLQKIEWKKLSARGDQFFDATSKGGENTFHDGVFDVYVHSDDTYHVVVAFRAPVNIDDQIHLMEAAPYCVATLTVNPPPPPADSDDAPANAADESKVLK